MKWITLIAVVVCFSLAVATGAMTYEYLGLKTQLATTESQLVDTAQKYGDLLELFGANQNGELTPPIETRLGIKLLEGSRFPNYLWITGQVENTGNLTLYNAKLRFVLNTVNGTDTKEYTLGTLGSGQVVEVHYSAISSLGRITGWRLEPVATYRP
jgi:hypothetical protein